MRLGVIGGSSLVSLDPHLTAFTDLGLKQFSKDNVVVESTLPGFESNHGDHIHTL